MRRILATLLVLFAAALPAPVSAETKAVAAGSRPFESEAAAVAAMKSYVERLGITAETSTSGKLPVVGFSSKLDNTTVQVRIVIDAKRDMIYVFLNRYLTLANDNPNRDAVLRELMKRNWDLNIGKFEWDPSDGEVRFSYCFTTENGVGFEAFRAIVGTLMATGDKHWPELKRLVDGVQASGSK